jgi:hypothetical protein
MRRMIFVASSIAAMAWLASVVDARAQTPQIGLPDVTATAPGPTPVPRRTPDPFISKWRNEEDKFVEQPCGTTRLSASVRGARCLVGYRLTNDLVVAGQLASGGSSPCDMGLDVVMYNAGNLAVEADILSFDPYKVTATGTIAKWCHIGQRKLEEDDFRDLNQVTRRGSNFGPIVSNDNGDQSVGFLDAQRRCIAISKNGPVWGAGRMWVMHATICGIDAQPVSAQDIVQTTDNLLVRIYDPIGNLRGAPTNLYSAPR